MMVADDSIKYMNETTKKIVQEIKDLNAKIADYKSELQTLFKQELTKLLVEHKAVVGHVRVYLNNHEFNDGDATYFGFNHEDLTVVFEDELGNESEYDGYGQATNEQKRIRKTFTDLFSHFDVDNFYETVFSNESGSLRFRANKEEKLSY
jgi:hypothetical protein